MLVAAATDAAISRQVLPLDADNEKGAEPERRAFFEEKKPIKLT
ncbi:hypothetical protein [Rhizobium sp. RU35A]|nr:hypothetical protein [Rhizobium sp. RU35A]